MEKKYLKYKFKYLQKLRGGDPPKNNNMYEPEFPNNDTICIAHNHDDNENFRTLLIDTLVAVGLNSAVIESDLEKINHDSYGGLSDSLMSYFNNPTIIELVKISESTASEKVSNVQIYEDFTVYKLYFNESEYKNPDVKGTTVSRIIILKLETSSDILLPSYFTKFSTGLRFSKILYIISSQNINEFILRHLSEYSASHNKISDLICGFIIELDANAQLTQESMNIIYRCFKTYDAHYSFYVPTFNILDSNPTSSIMYHNYLKYRYISQ